MLRISLVLCLVLVACQAKRYLDSNQLGRVEVSEKCAGGFVAIAGRCYQFDQSRVSWSVAQSRCRSRGAQLASIVDQEQYNGFLRHMSANNPGKYWTSGKFEDGEWIWTSKGKMVSRQWFWSSPPNSRTCLYFCSFAKKYWVKDCNNPLRFICEKPMDVQVKEVPAV